MSLRRWALGVWVFLAGCTTSPPDIDEIALLGFHSEEPERCRPSDVALDERQVASFFKRAEPIDGGTLHDEYEWAPCYLEGTLKYHGKACVWRVRAGATGEIECPAVEQYFGCKDCVDLFKGLSSGEE
ncbi:hypothetical protein BLL37_03530 [Pseudomonas azotoformans]|uniref:Lipoprotein n=1 Tax=Pseudomonas azotoformans TaxID=47878 RepID=A0A1V2JUF9_PSEAZ|nr:hypothetical protein [Pseudomonas azotoformans]OIN49046.1 hypothetical protein BFL39_10030 [Pseudomonas azotoformans]ONH48446.1 hypothetical protein BLL37_03530 [Pseudomonas azotoformans]